MKLMMLIGKTLGESYPALQNYHAKSWLLKSEKQVAAPMGLGQQAK